MNRKTIIIWGVVILVATIGILLTYFTLGNNGSSNSNVINFNQQNISDNNNTLPTEKEIALVEEGQSIGDYSDWSIMPTSLQTQLVDPKSGLVDYYYSKELGIAFSYETKSIVPGEEYLITSEIGGKTVYLHNYKDSAESGQSIEVINVEDNLRFGTVSNIIETQLLEPEQKNICKVDQVGFKYFVVSKDNIKENIKNCGQYGNINNKFIIKPKESGNITTKLIFINAGDREISFDGSMQGQYWYQSIVVE